MIIKPSTLEGVWIIERPIHRDFRGEYFEYYNEKEFEEELNRTIQSVPQFIQDSISISCQHVLRGFHGSFDDNWKLTQCLAGEIYSVIINNQKNHNQYLKWEGFTLSDKNRQQLLIGPGMGNSLLVMSKQAIYHYKQSVYYKGPDQQFTLNPFDVYLNVYWPINKSQAIMSQRDAKAPCFYKDPLDPKGDFYLGLKPSETLRLPLSSASKDYCQGCGIRLSITNLTGYCGLCKKYEM